jgi:hypothetical protein
MSECRVTVMLFDLCPNLGLQYFVCQNVIFYIPGGLDDLVVPALIQCALFIHTPFQHF